MNGRFPIIGQNGPISIGNIIKRISLSNMYVERKIEDILIVMFNLIDGIMRECCAAYISSILINNSKFESISELSYIEDSGLTVRYLNGFQSRNDNIFSFISCAKFLTRESFREIDSAHCIISKFESDSESKLNLYSVDFNIHVPVYIYKDNTKIRRKRNTDSCFTVLWLKNCYDFVKAVAEYIISCKSGFECHWLINTEPNKRLDFPKMDSEFEEMVSGETII